MKHIERSESMRHLRLAAVENGTGVARWNMFARQEHSQRMKYVIDNICHRQYIEDVAYEIEYADEFEAWWESLTADEQDSVARGVRLLAQVGVNLARPYADTVYGSKFPNMKELRVQHQGRPYRVLYAFDPRRTAMLLIGGDKTGNDRWYEEFVPRADAIYAQHLREIERE